MTSEVWGGSHLHDPGLADLAATEVSVSAASDSWLTYRAGPDVYTRAGPPVFSSPPRVRCTEGPPPSLPTPAPTPTSPPLVTTFSGRCSAVSTLGFGQPATAEIKLSIWQYGAADTAGSWEVVNDGGDIPVSLTHTSAGGEVTRLDIDGGAVQPNTTRTARIKVRHLPSGSWVGPEDISCVWQGIIGK